MLARLSALLAFTAAAVTVAAKPIVVRDSPVSLPIARRFNLTGVPSILKQDQARAKALKGRSQSSKAKGPSLKQAAIFNVDATNQAVDYVVSVGVGTPPTFYDLLIDTGSSNTWVGAGQQYVQTSSSVDTGDLFVSVTLGFMLSYRLRSWFADLVWVWVHRRSSTARVLCLVRSCPY